MTIAVVKAEATGGSITLEEDLLSRLHWQKNQLIELVVENGELRVRPFVAMAEKDSSYAEIHTFYIAYH